MYRPRTATSPVRSRQADVWFAHRPRLAIAVIAALFAGVLALRLATGSPTDTYSMLYVLPVALAASAFGQRGGTAAGLLGVVLTVLWTLARDVSLTPGGWAARVLPLLLLGFLLGKAVDRGRRAEAARRDLEVGAALHREAIEINDSLIQGMTAAKWAFESGRTADGLELLDATVAQAHQLVSELIRRADMGGRTESRGSVPR
jgi:hypothetical protein